MMQPLTLHEQRLLTKLANEARLQAHESDTLTLNVNGEQVSLEVGFWLKVLSLAVIGNEKVSEEWKEK